MALTVELMRRSQYVKTGRCDLLKSITLKEIEAIFAVTDPMGISREAIVIPLRTEHPGRLSILKDGKLEIVVERDGEFDDWLNDLGARIRALMDRPED